MQFKTLHEVIELQLEGKGRHLSADKTAIERDMQCFLLSRRLLRHSVPVLVSLVLPCSVRKTKEVNMFCVLGLAMDNIWNV